MKKYHKVWADNRAKSLEWLQEMLDMGFHVHHIDGDRENDSPGNLALVWGEDHLENIHLQPIVRSTGRGGRPKKEKPVEIFRFKDHAQKGTKY